MEEKINEVLTFTHPNPCKQGFAPLFSKRGAEDAQQTLG